MECNSSIYCVSWLYGQFEKFWIKCPCCEEKDVIVEEEKVMKEDGKSVIKKIKNTIKVCSNMLVKEFSMNVLKNRNNLYLFLEFYDNIKSKMKSEKSNKKKEYCTYIQNIFDLYGSMYDDDENRLIKKYQSQLENFNKIFENDRELSELKTYCSNLNLKIKKNMEKKNMESLSQDKDETFRPLTLNISSYIEKAPTEMVHENNCDMICLYLYKFIYVEYNCYVVYKLY